MERLRVGNHGELRLPSKMLDALGIQPGSFVRLEVVDGKLIVEKTKYDPFESIGKGNDPNALEKAFEDERKRAGKADRTFKKLMENPPEVRPEDHPDFWR